MKAVPRRLLVLGGGPVGVEMAQAVRRLGGEVVLVEGAAHVLPREPRPLGEALAEALRRDGVELALGVHATAARREGEDYVLELDDGRKLSGDRLLVATGRRPRVEGLGLETVGIKANARGIPVDAHLRAGERLWAIGDVNGIWQLTHVGKYQGRVVAANILGEPREANYEAVPRVTYTDPQAASVGAAEAAFSATVPVSEVAKTATYTRAYDKSNGFMTLLSDGERLTGAYALGPEAGEWLQQATLAIRARVPLDVLRDTIQPFPTFSEIYVAALKALSTPDHDGAPDCRCGDIGAIVRFRPTVRTHPGYVDPAHETCAVPSRAAAASRVAINPVQARSLDRHEDKPYPAHRNVRRRFRGSERGLGQGHIRGASEYCRRRAVACRRCVAIIRRRDRLVEFRRVNRGGPSRQSRRCQFLDLDVHQLAAVAALCPCVGRKVQGSRDWW